MSRALNSTLGFPMSSEKAPYTRVRLLLVNVFGSSRMKFLTPRRTNCSMTAEPVPPQPTTATVRVREHFLNPPPEGANVAVELVGRRC